MQRFVLRQNIQRYTDLLQEETDPRTRRLLLDLLASARRDLALLEAASFGALGKSVRTSSASWDSKVVSRFRKDFATSETACLLLDPRPGLRVVDINDAYAELLWTSARAACGERIFDLFPENPEEPRADGMANSHASLKATAENGTAQRMTGQRYDMRDAGGRFVERYWNAVNTPLLDDKENLSFLLLQVEEVSGTIGCEVPDPMPSRRDGGPSPDFSALRQSDSCCSGHAARPT